MSDITLEETHGLSKTSWWWLSTLPFPVPSWPFSALLTSQRPNHLSAPYWNRHPYCCPMSSSGPQHSVPPARFHMNMSPKWHAWIYNLIWSQILILQNHIRVPIHFLDLLTCLSKINNRSSNHLTAQKMTKYGEPVALAALFVSNSDTRVRSTLQNHLFHLPNSQLEPGNR